MSTINELESAYEAAVTKRNALKDTAENSTNVSKRAQLTKNIINANRKVQEAERALKAARAANPKKITTESEPLGAAAASSIVSVPVGKTENQVRAEQQAIMNASKKAKNNAALSAAAVEPVAASVAASVPVAPEQIAEQQAIINAAAAAKAAKKEQNNATAAAAAAKAAEKAAALSGTSSAVPVSSLTPQEQQAAQRNTGVSANKLEKKDEVIQVKTGTGTTLHPIPYSALPQDLTVKRHEKGETIQFKKDKTTYAVTPLDNPTPGQKTVNYEKITENKPAEDMCYVVNIPLKKQEGGKTAKVKRSKKKSKTHKKK